MRFIIMHKTSPHWEAGAIPSRDLIARVGTLLGELAQQHRLLGAEGLRASAEGVRLRFVDGTRTIGKGPFEPEHELPAGFSLLHVESIEDAIDWATRQAELLGDVEIDIRPVTEPWDIGLSARPPHAAKRRYMALRKATPASEAGVPPPPDRQAAMKRLVDETARAGVHIATENMRPSARGRRYKHSSAGVTMTDGPFTESKELIAGYIIVSAASLAEAEPWALRYIDVVEAGEVDVRELEDSSIGDS